MDADGSYFSTKTHVPGAVSFYWEEEFSPAIFPRPIPDGFTKLWIGCINLKNRRKTWRSELPAESGAKHNNDRQNFHKERLKGNWALSRFRKWSLICINDVVYRRRYGTTLRNLFF
jgi:hypothetical protein